MLSAIISPLVYRPRPTSCLTNAPWISLFIISCIFHDPVFFVPVDGISLCLCPGIAPVDPGCNRSWLSCFIINARAMVMAVWFLPVLAIPIVCNVSSHSYHMIVQEFPALLTWQTLGIHYHRLLCYPLPTIVCSARIPSTACLTNIGNSSALLASLSTSYYCPTATLPPSSVVREFPALLAWWTLEILQHRLLCYPLPTIPYYCPTATLLLAHSGYFHGFWVWAGVHLCKYIFDAGISLLFPMGYLHVYIVAYVKLPLPTINWPYPTPALLPHPKECISFRNR